MLSEDQSRFRAVAPTPDHLCAVIGIISRHLTSILVLQSHQGALFELNFFVIVYQVVTLPGILCGSMLTE